MFQSLTTVFGANEDTLGSDTNMFESALTRYKIRRICALDKLTRYRSDDTLTRMRSSPTLTFSPSDLCFEAG